MRDFLLAFVSLLITSATGQPAYPITGAWMKPRYTASEWNRTLETFLPQGGDTILVQAPWLRPRSIGDIQNDPEFSRCYGDNALVSATKDGFTHCTTSTEALLARLGVSVKAWATYSFDQDYLPGGPVIKCPQFEKRINGSRVYYLLVMPTKTKRSDCTLSNGDEVVVVLTAFKGVDPHSLLLQQAINHEMKVWLGIPGAPWLTQFPPKNKTLWQTVHLELTSRIIMDTVKRYTESVDAALPLEGFLLPDAAPLAKGDLSDYLELYNTTHQLVNDVNKKLLVQTFIDTRVSSYNTSAEQHANSLRAVASNTDVVAVSESRGYGSTCFYWKGEEDNMISKSDHLLADILRINEPSFTNETTYKQLFTASNQEVWAALSVVQQQMKVDLWLTIEAFENTQKAPCLPIDQTGSGVPDIMDRTNKFRLDKSLAAQGFYPSRVLVKAWDPDFTCRTEDHPSTLHAEVMNTLKTPVIANCSFHSRFNLSLVVVGFQLMAANGFEVNYPSKGGGRKSSTISGYYFWLDWGTQHGRLDGLQYIMMWDFLPLQDFRTVGSIQVRARNGNGYCSFRAEDYL